MISTLDVHNINWIYCHSFINDKRYMSYRYLNLIIEEAWCFGRNV